jgi:hypothetical protein
VSSDSFDNTGKKYNVSRIINPDLSFNLEAYKAYSPPFIPVTFAIFYGLSFASITATLTHTFLYYHKQMWAQARRPLSGQSDIHARLMSVYKPVPDWWYFTVFGLSHQYSYREYANTFPSDHVRVRCRCYRGVGYGFPCMGFRPRPLDPYVLPHLLRSVLQHSLCISAFLYTVPIGVIQAITNQQVGLQVITELIIGYALPGHPLAMMMFKTWGYITMLQTLQFTSNLKLAHYMKIPPRPMFFCQIVATIVAGTVQLGMQAWMFSNIDGLCTADQKDGFICPMTTVFGTTSIIVSLLWWHIYFGSRG